MEDVDAEDGPKLVGRGFYWQDLKAGQMFRTYRRTVTETDLVNFVGLSGMTESMFIEANAKGTAIKGRPVPAALVYVMMEGLIVQAMIQGTGLALLEMSQQIHAPVQVGDTVRAEVELTDLKPTSKSGRAVTTWSIRVFNQRDEKVMTYIAKRLLAGRPNHSPPA